jgi:predicted amidophosphoribosyltransferase
MATDPTLYGICDGCGMVYLLAGDDHCAECGTHFGCCAHEDVRCSCDTSNDERRAKVWTWSDCQKPGHEADCAVVHCTVCNLYSSDCDEPWRRVA